MSWAQRQETAFTEARVAVLRLLESYPSIVCIQAEYDGSGDEGWINDIDFLDADNNNVVFPEGYDPRDVAEDYAYQFLEDKYAGWEINEGSFGTVTILRNDDGTFSVTNTHNSRYEAYDTEDWEGTI